MARSRWQLFFGLGLIVLSTVFYGIHFLIFRDAHHIFVFGLGDVAFVFVEVLLVTLIIHRVLDAREKRSRMEKMNMVIGVFFSEIGTKLLAFISDYDPELSKIKEELVVSEEWSDREFSQVSRELRQHPYKVDPATIDLHRLREMLREKADFLLRLLENPTLIEHEAFTDLLQGTFHLYDELMARGDLRKSGLEDREHLAGDVDRAYGLLVREWLAYMKHLKANYPYLFVFALRTNPFDEKATPVVGG